MDTRRFFYQPDEIPYLLIHTGDDDVLRRSGKTAYREYGSHQRYRRQMMNAALTAFFITLFRRHEQDMEIPNIRMKSADGNLMYILRYMQANYRTVTLHSMASFFGYSERQMQRIILEATGRSFTDNIHRQKMTKAAECLSEGHASVGEVCEKTGFDSPNQFRKIFRRYYGMTPSEYRREPCMRVAAQFLFPCTLIDGQIVFI